MVRPVGPVEKAHRTARLRWSVWRFRIEPKQPCAFGHSRVIGDDDLEIVTERERGGKMDRVERSKDTRLQGARPVEDAVGDGNELDTSKSRPSVGEHLRPTVTHRTKGLSAQDGRRNVTSASPREERPQRA